MGPHAKVSTVRPPEAARPRERRGQLASSSRMPPRPITNNGPERSAEVAPSATDPHVRLFPTLRQRVGGSISSRRTIFPSQSNFRASDIAPEGTAHPIKPPIKRNDCVLSRPRLQPDHEPFEDSRMTHRSRVDSRVRLRSRTRAEPCLRKGAVGAGSWTATPRNHVIIKSLIWHPVWSGTLRRARVVPGCFGPPQRDHRPCQ